MSVEPAPSAEQPHFARSAAVMTVGTFLSRITGYLRIAALAYALGVSRLADSYNLANLMPNMVFELIVGGVVSSVMIPVFMDILVKHKRGEAWYVASAITNITLILLISFATVAIIFPGPFVYTQTFLMRDNPEDIQLVTFFFRFFVAQIAFYGIAAIATAILNSHRHFAAPAFAPIANNVVVVVTVLAFFAPIYPTNPELGLVVLALGTTLGVATMALIQVPPILRLGMEYRPVLGLNHPAVRKIGALALPVFFYVLLNQIGLTVANNLAFQFEGGVAAIQYAWPLFHLAYGLFSVSITSALFPDLSEHAAREDMEAFKRDFSVGLRATGFLLLPAAAGLFALNVPIVRLLLEHGSFDPAGTLLTAPILKLFALSVFWYATWTYMTRVFYALGDTFTPTWVNAIGVPVNIIANVILVGVIGVRGIALGHAINYLFVTVFALWVLRRRIGALNGRMTAIALSKQLAAAVGMALVAWAVTVFIGGVVEEGSIGGQLLQVSAGVGSAVLVYLGMCYVLGVRELELLKGVLRRSSDKKVPEGV